MVVVAHLTTVDMSLQFLVRPQLLAVRDRGDVAVGISAPGPWVERLQEAGVEHWPLHTSTRGVSLRSDLRAAIDLWRLLRRNHVDVLHTHNPKPGVYGRIIGRLAGVPVVVNTVHGLYATEDDPMRRRVAVYLLEAVASRFSDAELVQNEEDLALLGRWRIASTAKLQLLGNGVDLCRFAARTCTHEVRDAVRAELGVTDDQIVVGAVGRLVREKGYPELFDALRSLDSRYVLVVCGPAEPDKPDAVGADELAAAEACGVRVLGMRDDIDRLYRGMDIFVLPSHREGFPRAAMEAAAAGLPIVATDVRGCRQVVAEGVNGVLVPVRSPEHLADAIRRLGDDESLRCRMGRASAARAVDEFDERKVVQRVLSAYDAVIARKGLSVRSDGRLAPRRKHRAWQRAAKRGIDVVGAAVGLVVCAPVIGAAAAAVRVRMGRPVIFTQVRPGRDGQPFRIYKLRTMTAACDERGEPLPDQLRVTRLGRFLRSTSIDELPELVNVLKGDMSLVGPRPLLTEYLPLYTQREALRHAVRPGITGWAQINGRNDQMWRDRLHLDVWYVENWSIGLDLRILVRTLRCVAARQGISHAGHETMPPFTGERPVGDVE